MIKGALGRPKTVDIRVRKERRRTVASSKYSSIGPRCRRQCGAEEGWTADWPNGGAREDGGGGGGDCGDGGGGDGGGGGCDGRRPARAHDASGRQYVHMDGRESRAGAV